MYCSYLGNELVLVRILLFWLQLLLSASAEYKLGLYEGEQGLLVVVPVDVRHRRLSRGEGLLRHAALLLVEPHVGRHLRAVGHQVEVRPRTARRLRQVSHCSIFALDAKF